VTQDASCIEALLFAAAEPLSVEDLAKRLPEGADIGAGLADPAVPATPVAASSWPGGRPLAVPDRPDLAFLMTEERDEPRRLSKAAQETWPSSPTTSR
jgi:segregation and condensation protein B